MAVELEIKDGDPWWLSPDIWVVPGDDPNAAAGIPFAGFPAYMWARVHNHGSDPVANAEVRFYWADPSTAFDRTTAIFVGSSYVSLSPGETGEVLLLSPWIPEYVNHGHECILVETFHPLLDPLQSSPAFNTPNDRKVAQLNLSVVRGIHSGFFGTTLYQVNTTRRDQRFRLVAKPAPLATLKRLVRSLNLDVDLTVEPGKVSKLGFVDKTCPDETDLKGKLSADLKIEISSHRKTRRSLVGQVKSGPALIHVMQYHEDRLVGGQSVLVLPADAKPDPKARTKKTARRTAA